MKMRRYITSISLLMLVVFSLAPLGAGSSAMAQAQSCDTSGNKTALATPSVVGPGDLIVFEASGFNPGEGISFWFTLPNGIVFGTPAPLEEAVLEDGTIPPLPLRIPTEFAQFAGRWAVTFQGSASNHVSVAFFCIQTSPVGAPTPNPACGASANSKNGKATPNQVAPGDLIVFEASGFTSGEAVSFWFTLPDQSVFGTPAPLEGGVEDDGTIFPFATRIPQEFAQFPGTWGLTFQGASSGNTAVIFFCVVTAAQPQPTAPTATATAPAATATTPAGTAVATAPIAPTATTGAFPTVEATPGVVGMPRTGQSDLPRYLVLVFVALGLLSVGLAAQRAPRRSR
jgi:hypothetical protein